MNAMEYIEFVESLIKDPHQILASLTPEKVNILHMVWGIMGEASEYENSETRENDMEELGDLDFYLTGLEQALQILPTEESFDYDPILTIAEELFDKAKKFVVYNKSAEMSQMVYLTCKLRFVFMQGLKKREWDLEEIRAENYKKLMKRYPDGYSDKAAQDRADKPQGE